MDGPFSVATALAMVLQVGQASVVGEVRDETAGQPVAAASVSLADPGYTVVTSGDGRYVLANVSPGPHHIRVQAVGYVERMLHALVPASGTLEINVGLRPDPILLDGLEVHPPVPARGLEPESPTRFPDRGLSMAGVHSHPLLAEPDALRAFQGGEVLVDPEAPDGLHVRGGGTDQVAFLLDGFPVLSPYHTAGVFSAWNPDALARIDLTAAAPSAELPSALSGVVSAETRSAASTLEAQGGVSNTQVRATVSAPLAESGAAFLVSFRSGFPGFVVPPDETSYLRAESGDLLGKVEAPILGGRLRLLSYESENEVGAAATPASLEGGVPARHAFGWNSLSLGAEWSRSSAGSILRVKGWRAALDASARWVGAELDVSSLRSERSDLGLQVTLERLAENTHTTVGFRLEQTETAYRVSSSSAATSPRSSTSNLPAVVGFAQVGRRLFDALTFEGGASITGAARGVHVGPRGMLIWSPLSRWTLSGSYARLHQYTQSARNPESVVRTIFPADLWIDADGRGKPFAETDQLVFAIEHRPGAGVRLGAQAFTRTMGGLVLVAPVTGAPFTEGDIVVGNGRAKGASLDLTLGAARYSALAAYGWQEVRLEQATASYTPEYGSSHSLEAGLLVFPTPTYSLRAAVTGVFGRHGTATSGPLEWESCNLLDLGCEFGGSPIHETSELGGVRLPSYVRVDLGMRKHWHVHLAGQDVLLGLHGTLTNVFGRKNLLILTTDPTTGAQDRIGLRPRAPLVVGMDWRF